MKIKNEVFLKLGLVGFLMLILIGCNASRGNYGQVQSYKIYSMEADWIRNGDPIEFEGDLWYPADGTENLQDTEVYLIGEYKGVQYFVEKTDVRPYKRLYTKFDKNKFRYFLKRKD